MIDIDRWQEIYFMLSQHKLRTCLTAFGVFWGMFMLVMLLGVGKGLENGAVADFNGNVNAVFMWGQGKTQLAYKGMPLGRRLTMKDDDLQAMRQTIPELGQITGVNELAGWQVDLYISRNNQSGTFSVRGVEPSYFSLANLVMLRGRFVNQLDYDERRKVAVIGTGVYDILFEPDENPIGKSIKIKGIDFQVIGIYKSAQPGEGGRQDAERIILPNSSQRHTFNQTGWIGYIHAKPKPGEDAVVLEEKIRKLLMKRHRIHPDDTGVLGSWNAQLRFDKVMGLFSAIRIFSWVVAIGTIVAGVIGVGNIMLIIVKERTKEIGVRKALGARASNIVSTIVQESLVLTIFSGYLGLVVGVVCLELISDTLVNMPDMSFGKAEIDFTTALTALLALIVAGVLASILPASKAAKVDPFVALQDE